MPVKSKFVGPSTTEEEVVRTIFDPDPDDQIAITRTEIVSVNGSSPGSQPSWVTFDVRPQQVKNGRAEREVHITFDITGLRLNSIYQFVYEIEASDGRTSSTHQYEVTVDDLVSSGAYRLTWMDFDAVLGKAEDFNDPSDPYQLFGYPDIDSSVEVLVEDYYDGNWPYHMKNGMEVDADPGYIFVKEIADANSYDAEAVRILRIDMGTGNATAVTPTYGTDGWDIDRENEHIYYAWPPYGGTPDWEPPSGPGIYRNDYSGSNRKKIADNYAGGLFSTNDIEVDAASDTMILVGQNMLTLDYYGIKTSLTNPDVDVSHTLGSTGEIQMVDVDWSQGLVFTVEGDGASIARRQLSDLSLDQRHSIGGSTPQMYGLTVNPVDQEVWWVRNQKMYSAPYSDISNTTVEKEGLVHFPTFQEVNSTNAHPKWDHLQDVTWRK